MNEFHQKYGNGGKWYLNPENYDDHFLDDPARCKYIHDFYADMASHDARKNMQKVVEQDASLQPSEFEKVIRDRMKRQKDIHYGQVVPVEEIEQILKMCNTIMRFACLCRYMYEEGAEFRSCYLLSTVENSRLKEIMADTHAEYLDGSAVQGIEIVEKEEAIRHFREMDKMGLIHTVWTLHTPYTATICNCDPVHCSALYTSTKNRHNSTLFMADYIAEIDETKCVGCRKCKMACQFAALEYSPLRKKVSVNASRCIGCGVCRVQCPKGAVSLTDRESHRDSAGIYEIYDRK